MIRIISCETNPAVIAASGMFGQVLGGIEALIGPALMVLGVLAVMMVLITLVRRVVSG